MLTFYDERVKKNWKSNSFEVNGIVVKDAIPDAFKSSK